MPIAAEERNTAPSYALKSSCQSGPALKDKPNWLEVQCQDWQRSLASAGCNP